MVHALTPEQQLLKIIYTHGPVSRTQLSELTGIQPATVSRATARLLANHAIEAAGKEAAATHTGPRQTLLVVAKGGPIMLGIELTAVSFSFVLANQCGAPVAQQVVTHPIEYDRAFLNADTLLKHTQAFLAAHREFPPVAAGIALPGHFIARTKRMVSTNEVWAFFDFSAIEGTLGVPVFYQNNVHCEALAESLIGAHRNGENLVYVHVGRGVFSSTIHDGTIYGAENFSVGEISHTIVDPEGELCDCGRRGCLHTLASTEWLVKKARRLYASAPNAPLHLLAASADAIDFETVLAAYQMSDRGVTAILTDAVRFLAASLNNLALVIDARRMIVHGRLFDQPDLARLLQYFLSENQFQLTAVAPQEVYIKSFTPYDGAIGGAMYAFATGVLDAKDPIIALA